MSPETEKAEDYANRLYAAALGVMATAHVDTERVWNREPKIIALAIFGRTLSIYKAALILVKEKHFIEARMFGRSLYESLLWIAALLERGDAFVKEMLEDETVNRRALGQTTMDITVRHGADVNSEGSLKLRGILRELSDAYQDPKKLHANKVAAMGKLEVHYIDYARLSLDALHCSITVLGRHVSSEKVTENHTVVTVNVEPRISEKEQLGTILLLCRAMLGATIAINDMVGPTVGFSSIVGLVDEYDRNGWRGEA